PLTLTSIANAIVGSAIIGKYAKGDERFLQGPFGHDTPTATINRTTEALSTYFEIVKHSNEARWDRGKEGLLCTNVGVEAYIRLLGELCGLIHSETRNDPRELSIAELM